MIDNAAFRRATMGSMADLELELTLADAAATEELGAALARTFQATAPSSAVVYWYGDLGTGKTTCIRSLLRSLGVGGVIRSPTYTLLETYPLAALTCVHVDLYRLEGASAVDELGLRDGYEGESLLLVEWPEKGAGALPPADLVLRLDYSGDARTSKVAARSGRGRQWLEMLLRDGSLTAYVSNLT